MPGLSSVPRGVSIRRAITAADLTALEADPQVKPWISALQALLTAVDCLGELGHLDVVEVIADGVHCLQHPRVVKANPTANNLGPYR